MKVVFGFKKNICTIITSIVNVIIFAEFNRFFNFQYNYFNFLTFSEFGTLKGLLFNIFFGYLTFSGFRTLKGLHCTNNFHSFDTNGANPLQQINNLGFIISKTISIKIFGNSFISVFFFFVLVKNPI